MLLNRWQISIAKPEAQVVNDALGCYRPAVAPGQSRVLGERYQARAQAAALLGHGVSAGHSLPELLRHHLATGYVGVPVRLYVSWPPAARVSGLPFRAVDGALLYLRHNREAARAVRLTVRCQEILKLLKVAGWLRTSQLHRRCFGRATADAARRRLRTLARAGYVVKVQPNRMTEALFRLGPTGKQALERAGARGIVLERHPPKQLEHLLGVNDVRVAAELSLSLAYFYAYWELPAVNWKQPIIPDAIFGVGHRAFALEFDRGGENLQFFIRTKVSFYQRGFDGFPLDRLIIVTDRQARMCALAKAIGNRGTRILLTTLDVVQRGDLTAPIFFETSLRQGVKLL
jgi:hypothetical protein